LFFLDRTLWLLNVLLHLFQWACNQTQWLWRHSFLLAAQPGIQVLKQSFLKENSSRYLSNYPCPLAFVLAEENANQASEVWRVQFPHMTQTFIQGFLIDQEPLHTLIQIIDLVVRLQIHCLQKDES
jgi:hypothetical protein